MLSDASIQSIRSRFPIFKKKIYLNSCSQGALSDAVESSVRRIPEKLARSGLSVGRVGAAL